MDERVLPEWTVIIPVKPLDRAKTRLGVDGNSAAPALAFFQDTLAAVRASESVRGVVVATRDQTIAQWAEEHGAVVVDDSAASGINAAAAVAARSVGVDVALAVVLGDLPCLTPAALDAVLSLAATRETSFVRDAAGTGTTIWATTVGAVTSQFGPDSAAAHAAAGAADLVTMGDPNLLAPSRRDVDTAEDLNAALALAVGAHTAALFGRSLVLTVAREVAVDPDAVVPAVDESGRWHDVPGHALAEAGFRLVRVGQRLVVDLALDGSPRDARLP